MPKNKNLGGRPKIWEGEKLEEMCRAYETYINETPIPIVAEFAYKNDIRKATLYEQPRFAYLTKKATEKKEAQLEIMALSGRVNTTFAIFSLKQLGWTDRQEVHQTGELTLLDIFKDACKDDSDG